MRYEDGQNKGSVTDWPFTWGQKGCGYMVSTVEDMWRFSEAIDGNDFIDAKAKELWFTVQKESYALGWTILKPTAENAMPLRSRTGGTFVFRPPARRRRHVRGADQRL